MGPAKVYSMSMTLIWLPSAKMLEVCTSEWMKAWVEFMY